MCYDLGIGRRLQRAFSKKHTAKKRNSQTHVERKEKKRTSGSAAALISYYFSVLGFAALPLLT